MHSGSGSVGVTYGVGLKRGVGVMVGVNVGENVGVMVGVSVGEDVGVIDGVKVGDGVEVGDGVAVKVAVAVGVRLGVAVGAGGVRKVAASAARGTPSLFICQARSNNVRSAKTRARICFPWNRTVPFGRSRTWTNSFSCAVKVLPSPVRSALKTSTPSATTQTPIVVDA